MGECVCGGGDVKKLGWKVLSFTSIRTSVFQEKKSTYFDLHYLFGVVGGGRVVGLQEI